MEKGSVLHLKNANVSSPEMHLSAPPPEDTSCVHKVYQYAMPEEMLDPDAAKVVRRLGRFGYDAYLVGGSVRDSLFDVKPKDFDVATSALPAEVKRLFRNCRLIGRRFRLAHLLFKNEKVIEVATFRRNPTSEDDVTDRHAAENLFGGPADDAIRRDFTINALMYDVGRREIHDYVGGIQDIKARILRTIGEPERRFLEDPVRIIRAVKFAERLSLKMDPEMVAAAHAHAPLVAECAPARLVEELYKILRTGRSARCFAQLHHFGVLEALMPGFHAAVSDWGGQDPFRILAKADQLTQQAGPLSDVTMLSALLYPFVEPLLFEKGDTAAKVQEHIQALTHPMTFPKRCVAMVRQILTAQRRLVVGPKTARVRRILEREYAFDALALLGLTAEDDAALSAHDAWSMLAGKRTSRSAEAGCVQPRRRRRPRRIRRKTGATPAPRIDDQS